MRENKHGASGQTKQRPQCGTCRWYDGLGDACRNVASPRSRKHAGGRETCLYWEADR